MPAGQSSLRTVDNRSPNMMQLEDTATQLLMMFAQNPMSFLQSLGMPSGQAQMQPQHNAFAARANQPGISQMLYGGSAPRMQLPTQTQLPQMQQSQMPQWTPPPASLQPTQSSASAPKSPVVGRMEDPEFMRFLNSLPHQARVQVLRNLGKAGATK